MLITPLPIAGAFVLEQERYTDERGSFARQFCMRELAERGLDFVIKQCNVSHNTKAGVLRGMHYQRDPYPEIKIVSCFMGAVYDVIADLRPDSPTYLDHQALELSQANGRSVYIPPGVAHGFQTLTEHSMVYYQLSEFFVPEAYAGVRFDDPRLGISWPQCQQRIINERDANYALL